MTRARPAASISALWSTPTTSRAGTRRASSIATAAVPEATSRTRVASRRYARDEEGAPARILSEREQARVAVVRRAERREQLARVARPRGDLGHASEHTLDRWRSSDDLEQIAAAAAAFAEPGERVTGILAAELLRFGRIYLCAYAAGDERPTWLALDASSAPVASLDVVREAAKLAALCEIAEETAGGGDLEELRQRLRELRETEAPEGIEAAEAAAAELASTLETEPRLATTDYLDRIGAATRRLEQALGDDAGSPFAAAMQQALSAADEVAAEVEERYKGPLA